MHWSALKTQYGLHGFQKVMLGSCIASNRKKTIFVQAFRAALAEFVSIEDILPLDLTARGITKQRLRLNETPNPHLHVFRELRNHEIHLRPAIPGEGVCY